MPESILYELCQEKGIKLTGQRKVIAKVISQSDDHPDIDQVYQRAKAIDANMSIPTIYRTMKLFEDLGLIDRLDLGDGKARYEEATDEHHHHLIDIESGEIHEFQNEELESLKIKIAAELGFDLMDHRLELYGRKKTA